MKTPVSNASQQHRNALVGTPKLLKWGMMITHQVLENKSCSNKCACVPVCACSPTFIDSEFFKCIK